MLVAALALSYAGASCARRPSPPTDPPQAAAPGPLQAAAPPSGPRGEVGVDPEPAPIAMKPAAAAKAPAKQRPSPASSLGGHDRRLTQKPFETVMASDFELGPLAGDEAADALGDALRALEGGLVSGELPYERFGDGAAAVARVLYGKPALDGIRSVRFSKPLRDSGGIASVEFRAFSGDADSPTPSDRGARSCLGLAILAKGGTGDWRVEHFELDLAALETPAPPRAEAWDPYTDR